jgi:hypothetical protein
MAQLYVLRPRIVAMSTSEALGSKKEEASVEELEPWQAVKSEELRSSCT